MKSTETHFGQPPGDADAIDAKGDRWVKWQSGYRSRKAVEAACVDFEVAPIERVADEGRYKPRRIERVASEGVQLMANIWLERH